MKITRYYKINEINWANLPRLRSQIESIGVKISSINVQITNFPDTVEYPTLEEASRIGSVVKPAHFSIYIYGTRKSQNFTFSLSRLVNIYGQERIFSSAGEIESESDLDKITEGLDLITDSKKDIDRQIIGRSVFIAHRFDATGNECAEKVARFLELLGFTVSTGRGFAPSSIGDKVKRRMQNVALVFVILSPGEDETWLVQESVLGHVNEKPVFILKDIASNFKPAIFGDHEFIPFQAPSIENAYVPILEGLKELNLLNFKG